MNCRYPLVLMYHGIGTVPASSDPDNLFVPEYAFLEQLARLTRHGFTPLTEEEYLDELASPRESARPRFLLTFDDGYVSVLERAAPVLESRGLPAICYVSPHLLGQCPDAHEPPEMELLDAAGVRELHDRGVTIGCHSGGHDSMSAMGEPDLAVNTCQARRDIAALCGRPPRTFAYPYGHHGSLARRAVAAAGFDCAFATWEGHGRFAIPRIDINATDTARTFDMKISRVFPYARRALDGLPALRRAIHHAVGFAPRARP